MSVDRLQALGLAAVEQMNPDAITKHMQPSGNSKPDVYICGESPGQKEDEAGCPFVGPTGQMIRNLLPSGYKYRFDNVCRTLPPLRNGSRTPTRNETEPYRLEVQKSVKDASPCVLLAVGAISAAWCLGETVAKAGINSVRGRRFPASIGGHTCWCYPVVHPSHILRMESANEYQEVPASEHRRYFELDIARVFQDLDNGLPKPVIEPPDLASTLKGITIEKRSIEAIRNFLDKISKERTNGIDLETNRYRPYADGAKILTAAIGTKDNTIAFPLDHKQATWTKAERAKLREIFYNYLISKVPKVAHNAPFELEWLVKEYGDSVAWESFWHDTMGMAYCIDERQSAKSHGKEEGFGISLNFCCVLNFGLDLKDVKARIANMWGWNDNGEIDRNRLDDTNLDDVLAYDGRDTKYCHKLYDVQKQRLKDDGLWEAYLQWVKRVPPIAIGQVIGVPVSQQVNKTLRIQTDKRIQNAIVELHKTKAIRDFEKKYGEYKDSKQCNTLLFRDMLRRTEGQTRKGFDYKEETLAKMADEPVAAALLKVREVKKIGGTYLERMDSKHPKTHVFSDGKAHTSYKHCAMVTKRVGSVDPALQNIPRDGELVKKQYVAEKDCVAIFADFGAQEARLIAVASKDPNLIKFMRDGFDFHMVWAEKLIKAWPDSCRKFFGSLDAKAVKQYRTLIKSKFVFAGFYRATVSSRARSLDIPARVMQKLDDELWEEFSQVKVWQIETLRKYKELGYVEGIGGTRRHGPMSESQVCNNGIQMGGSDLTMDAWYRAGKFSYKNKMPWFYPSLAVHDDLTTFSIPKEKEAKAIELAARIMTDVRFAGAELVPWSIEVSHGYNWGQKKLVGVFSSDKIDDQAKQIPELLAKSII